MTVSGYGLLRFIVTRKEAKTVTLLIGCAYITNSGYYVTIDSNWVNEFLLYCMLALMLVYIYILIKAAKIGLGIIDVNIAYIR